MASKGWTATYPQINNKKAIQHTAYVKMTKLDTIYKLDYHLEGSPSRPNIHVNDYWKIYEFTGTGPDEMLERIGYGSFKNNGLIKDSSVYIDGLRINGG